MIGAIVAVVIRELTRFQRQRGRLVATFARPLLWLVVIGAGFEKLVPTQGTVSYKQFLLPGLYGMVVLFSTMLSALATVHDREFGPIRMLANVAERFRFGAFLFLTAVELRHGLIRRLLVADHPEEDIRAERPEGDLACCAALRSRICYPAVERLAFG